MAARNKPFEQFGPYILFKKLEQDSLGDLWRAGRIDGGQLGPTLALRRMTGGNRAALAGALEAVSQLLPRLAGASFARDQVASIVDGIPFLAWDYAGGRSLRHIIDRARGGKETQPNPLPIDQAIVIAEKVALSLATMAELRDGTGTRLSHGALLPQFIWISDDGEIRVAGQQLAGGIIESLVDPKVAADIGRYFAPEIRTPGQKPKSADVYSMGAILFLLVTGQEPPDAMTASAFVAAVRAAKTMAGAPIPDDIRVILDKSFNLDPSMRFASIADMKQAVSALAHGGKYSATTFNLAFYLSNLLKKEMEGEAAEREKEAKVNVAPYLETPKPAPVVAAPAPTSEPAMFAAAEEPRKKSKAPLAVAAAIVLAALGVGGWMMMGRMSAKPAQPAVQAALVPPVPAPKPRVISEPIVVGGDESTSTAPVTATTGSADAEAQKKAFEAAVKAKLQEEMMKLQDDYMAELKKQQSRDAPVAATAPAAAAPAPAEERPAMTAAQLTQQMRETRQEETATAAPAPVPTQTTATTAPAAAAVVPGPAPAPVRPAIPAIREGDVVAIGDLDEMPRPVRAITAVYPPIARQQRISATVVVSALIDETGEVTQVKVLRGVGRFGIDEAAQRAMKSARFTSPMKAGKRVKTWYPQTIEFRP